ncbi:RloB family protein [Sorangium sp. So ce764]|uniref:RloB family protein n=1 Tax=Sorangium sp. So ce764 TaxID=3133320 RepID=UPI003F60FE0E
MVGQKYSRTGLIDRTVQRRDARLFIVATEGAVTEPQYFRGLQERGIVDRLRVKIEVLPTPADEGTSAPRHVLDRLSEVSSRYNLIKDDERWLVIDADRVWERHLPQVAREALQKGFFVAVSRPCFELWLLLHVSDDVGSVRTCDDCSRALRAHLGGYSKSNLDMDWFPRSAILDAIDRARALDPGGGDRWPQATGSGVFRLASRLLERPGG